MTHLESSAHPSVFGQSLTLTAIVIAPVAPGGGTPAGSVQFMNGMANIGGPVSLIGGIATVTTSQLSVGTQFITAHYSGDSGFNSSIGNTTQQVDKSHSRTTVTSNPNPSGFGHGITLSATVSALAPGAGSPSGTVQFTDNGSPIGFAVALSGGFASLSTSQLGAGSHTITAEFFGDGNFHASSGGTTHTVNAQTPFININTNTFTFDGNAHSATATASGQNGPVNGTFTFTYSPGGSTVPVNAGSYGVTATFTSADPNYTNAVATLAATPAGGTWMTRTNLPTARYGPPSAVINNKIYVVSGCCVFGNARLNTLEVYDTQTNAWTTKAPIPTGVYGAAAAGLNGMLYVAGGQQTSGNIATLQVYNPATDSWSLKAPMPDASGGVSAAVINSQLYVIGGMDPSNQNEVNHVRRYDPVANSWTSRAPMPTARVFAGAAAANNRIYVVGGYDGVSPLNMLEVYDANSNTWSTKAPMPTARYGMTVEFLNGRLLAIGGNGARPGLTSRWLLSKPTIRIPTRGPRWSRPPRRITSPAAARCLERFT